MCYILCLAVPERLQTVTDCFDGRLALDGLSDAPIVSAVVGDAPAHVAYAVTLNGCSCDLLVGGHHGDACPELLTDGLQTLLQNVPTAALLKHWFTRPIDEVEVTAESHREITLQEFKALYPRIDEDVRYVVHP